MSNISIAVSQKSAPFFEKSVAVERSAQENGGGPRIDRIEMTLVTDTQHNEYVSKALAP